MTLTFSVVVGLVIPTSTKLAIDYAMTDHPGPAGIPAWLGVPESWKQDRVGLLWRLGGAMVGLSAVSVLIGMWGRWQMTRLTKRTQALLRRRAFEHAARLPLHRVQQLKSGGVTSILREDAGQTADLLFSMIYNPFRAVVQLTGTLIILAVVDWRMVAGAAILAPTIWLTHRTWISRIRPVFRDIRMTRQGIDSHTTEAFGGMRVVRGFNREMGEAGRFTRGSHYMIRQEILAWWWSRIIDIAWSLLVPTASVGVLIYGGSRVVKGQMTIGDVMMFMTYLLMLLGPLEALTSTAVNIQTNLAGFDRVLDILAEPSEFADSRPDVLADRAEVRGRVTLNDVWFSYPARKARLASASEDRPGAKEPARAGPAGPGVNGSVAPRPDAGNEAAQPVIKGVSLDVNPGETIALVGASGAGKTTLCNLIARFYDPSKGTIALDSVDLKRIEPSSYRRLLGIVEQDVFLFDGTITENIGYARRDATMEEITEAARAANAHDFIQKLEQGYDTLIGERGVRLSGGQKQRIAIARALLADPVILILDEATSNLDAESEALIQKSLARLMLGRTCFVIAHRLSTIRNANRIVVLEDGAVREIGTHEQLLAAGGRYADLLRTQLEAGQVAPAAVREAASRG
ncbi:MAG: ABC transporter ATP-binding protein [Phycisphaerales bacterium]|nr:ABC transporter ATP-binding protein [Phycisphaerales bacterium]